MNMAKKNDIDQMVSHIQHMIGPLDQATKNEMLKATASSFGHESMIRVGVTTAEIEQALQSLDNEAKIRVLKAAAILLGHEDIFSNGPGSDNFLDTQIL